MAIRKEEREAEGQKEEGESQYEMKFFGIAFKEISGTSKFIYALIFISIVGAALYYGISQLDQKKEKGSNKRRRSPKK
jgi:hypothetical protein